MERLIALISALILICACSQEKPVVQDNSFTLSCEETAIVDGVLDFKGAGGSAIVMVNHGPTAAVWSVQSSLDDVWCSFKKNVDMLVITVEPNLTGKVREARAGVVMGDNIQELTIRQEVFVYGSDPNLLPDTKWDEDEKEYEN